MQDGWADYQMGSGAWVVGHFDFHAIISCSSQILFVIPAAIAGVMRMDR